ncbi:MAG: selenium-binding protein SBP56-related protein [Pseudonocardiaceae bacterium]
MPAVRRVRCREPARDRIDSDRQHVGRAAHPAEADQPLAGGPQMVEVSRDGQRLYSPIRSTAPGVTSFPRRRRRLDGQERADPAGGLTIYRGFFLHGDDFRGLRVHQVRLQGGDASSDSSCYR